MHAVCGEDLQPGADEMSTCKPFCELPPSAFPGEGWTCPACGTRWYAEEHVERMIAWCREHVVPAMTEAQLAFLRAYMCGKA